jgi:hypothetical protein
MSTVAIRALQAERRALQTKMNKIDRALTLLGVEAEAPAKGKAKSKAKGRTISEETRAKMRASQQARVARQQAAKLGQAPVNEATPLGTTKRARGGKKAAAAPVEVAALPEQGEPVAE